MGFKSIQPSTIAGLLMLLWLCACSGGYKGPVSDHFDRFLLTILPIGSYEKRWFMKHHHMNPEDAVKTHIALRSIQSVGIHFGTFAEHPEQTVNAHEKDLGIALDDQRIDKSEF